MIGTQITISGTVQQVEPIDGDTNVLIEAPCGTQMWIRRSWIDAFGAQTAEMPKAVATTKSTAKPKAATGRGRKATK